MTSVGGSLALVALAGVVGTACSGTEVPTDPVTPGRPALEISARVSHGQFIQGDSTIITVILRNVSSRAVQVSFANSCTIVYAIRTAAGALAVPSGGAWACEPIASRISLDRLEATERAFIWKGEGLPAGDYLAYGALGADLAVVSPGVAVRLIPRATPP